MTAVIDGIDLANPDNFVEGVPFEWFRRLRQEAPVAWHREPGPNAGFWAVTRYDDLVSIHMDWATFSSEIGAVSLEELDPEQLDIRRSMLETDPPRHTKLRSICAKRFSARGVGRYEDWIRDVARDVLDAALAGDETFDFVGAISRELPIRFLCSIFTVPQAGCTPAHLVGRQDDRQPGSRAVGRGHRQGRHRGLPAVAVPLSRRARRVRLRGCAGGSATGGAQRRRDPSARDRPARRRTERARVPQLLLAVDDRRQRDDAPHDQRRDARA